MNRFAATVY